MNYIRFSRKTFLVFLLFFCALGILIYSNTFQVPFVFDDERMVLENPVIRKLKPISLWYEIRDHRRYLSFLSFAVNYRIHGTEVAGYHWTNLCIHILNAWTVVWMTFLLLKTPRLREQTISRHSALLAMAAGLIFLTHPIQTQAVTYISQRFESLATFFYLLAACLYLKARLVENNARKSAMIMMFALLSGVASVFSKETAFTIPFSLLLLELVFFKQGRMRWLIIAVFFVIFILTAGLFLFTPGKLLVHFEAYGISSERYLFTQLKVIPEYIRLIFIPLRQNLDPNYPMSAAQWDTVAIGGAFIILSIAGLALSRMRRNPFLSFGILWFFIVLSPTSSIIALPDAMYEHRLYPVMAGIASAFCVCLMQIVKKPKVFICILLSIVVALSFLTYQRNFVWQDTLTLWEDVAAKSPPSPRIYSNLGDAYRQQGDYEKAVYYYLRALTFKPAGRAVRSQILTNLCGAYAVLGDFEAALHYGRQAVSLDAANFEALGNVSYVFIGIKDYENAVHFGKRAVAIRTSFDLGYNNIGVAYRQMGNYKEARRYFQLALQYSPRNPQYLKNLSEVEKLVGNS